MVQLIISIFVSTKCAMLVVALNLLTPVAGASVLSARALLKSQTNGCYITLPTNRRFAPAITDQKSGEDLVPIFNRESGSWFLKLEHDSKIKATCGRGNELSNFEPYYYLLLTCISGTQFLDHENEAVSLAEGIECTNPRKPTSIVYRNGTCFGKGTNLVVEFAYESPPRKYYTVCMDEVTSGTLSTSSYLDGESIANGLVEGSGGRPDFRGQAFYPFPIKQAYKWENAFEHLSDLLGSSDIVNTYFPTQQYRFSRGHLFPNGDAIKRVEKHATFYYMNTVPQWQVLNGGNWVIVEQDVRDLAASLSRTFKVTTGAFGVTTLPDDNNNNVELWLARDSQGKLRLPVPRLVWKVIYDSVGNSAVAIVQVNNPWVQVEQIRAGVEILCSNDLCRRLTWLRSSSFHAIRKGYTYCCDVNELRKTIPYVPDIKYKDILGVNYTDNNESDYSEDDYEDESDSSQSDEDSESSERTARNRKSFNVTLHDINNLLNDVVINTTPVLSLFKHLK